MKIVRNTTRLPENFRRAVYAIGNFDGVHRGHLAVLDCAKRLARDNKAPVGVLTFEPHPRRFLKPDLAHFNLTPFDLKARLLELLELDVLVVASFNKRFANLSARQFVERILVRDLDAAHVVTGQNFFFGKGREGDPALLGSIAGECGLKTMTVGQQTFKTGGTAEAFSSTRVRDALKAGEPELAADLLGYWWTVMGEVERGDERGAGIGFPTANVMLDAQVEPMFGVYVVRARTMGTTMGPALGGVANLGLRPTFARDHPVLEVHLFDFDGDLYGRTLMVEMISFLRPERKFDGLDALKAQIGEDAGRARAVLGAMAQTGDPMAQFPIGRALAPA